MVASVRKIQENRDLQRQLSRILVDAGYNDLENYNLKGALRNGVDALLEGGWLAEYNLEPYSVTLEDEETGTTETFVAGLRLDSVTALRSLGAMDNEGAFLCLIDGGGNPETTRRALEYMMKDLTEAAND